jgi:hypothetical protein
MKQPISVACAVLLATVPSFAQAAPSPEQPPQPPQPPQQQGGGAAPSDDAFKMGSPAGLPEGLTEEVMWPAASAEGWRKPCLVTWQRSFDDALRVARAEVRPLLVAVNMDGEIASEHYAGVRYREPDTAAMLARYVCVIASVYRHTPRDYDEEGRRVECPRFGTVTCREHIENERELYEKYFDGKRVSPRHIVLDLDAKETYDVYYSWDTATVFTTFRKGVEGWPEPLEPSERTLRDQVRSADVEDRIVVERLYREGDRETRRAMLEVLVKERAVDQTEVLRSAIFGFDLELAALARQALAQCETEGALDLMAEALKVPLEPAEKELLLGAVARLGERSPRARTLAALHSGLSLDSRLIEAQSTQDLAQEYVASARRTASVLELPGAAEARLAEPGALLELAEALLARADDSSDERYAALLFQDARTAADGAERLGAKGPRLDAVVAVTASERGEYALARARVVAAVEGGALRLAEDAPASTTLTPGIRMRLLRLFAEARQRAIRDAYRAGGEWPPEWLSDVNAAYASLTEAGLADPEPLVDYHDFLRWIGATPRANTVLEEALARFPDSAELHERLRARLLYEGGPQGLEHGYEAALERRSAAGGEPTQLTWFAGYASLVAAEHHRRRSEFEAATAAYGRAIVHFERNMALFPEGRDNCLHFMALGHAGSSRVALERKDLAAATTALLASLELRPASAATPDGLNITPVMTAKMLEARLLEAGDAERAAQVRAALDALDLSLLEPPPSELPGAGRRRGPPGR